MPAMLVRPALVVTGLAAVAALCSVAAPARADEDCPPGSKSKSENGFTWCEPNVCERDDQCAAGEVCRRIPLCVQVGKVDAKGGGAGDGGERLVATQRCAAGDKPCPDTTVCSDKPRCLGRTQAERLGLLTAPAASGSAAAAPSSGASSGEKKSACGCDTVGAAPGTRAAAAFACFALVAGLRRRRRGGA